MNGEYGQQPGLPWAAHNHDPATQTALLELLYGNLARSMPAVIIVTLIAAYVLRRHADPIQVHAWVATMLCLALMRLASSHFWQTNRTMLSLEGWRRLFIGLTLATALGWTALLFLFFSGAPLEIQLFIGFFIIGISAGAMASLAADIRLILAYINLLILPLVMALLLEGSELHIALGLMALTYVAMISVAAVEYHRTLRRSIERGLQLHEANTGLVLREKESRRLFEHTPTGIFYYDTKLRVVACNRAFAETVEARVDQLVGLDMSRLPDQRILPTIRAVLEDRPGHYQGYYRTVFSHKELWGDIDTAPLHDEQGRVIGGIGAIQDRTREHRALQEVTQLALYDVLTGLPNRKLLMERIGQALQHARRNGHLSALLYLDLDDFKRVNDTHGHAQGDQLLVQFVGRIQPILRDEDTLARLGGDEFVILATELGESHEAVMRHGLRVADRILQLCIEPFVLKDHTLYISPSIGVVLIDPKLDPAELLRRADTAMYRAKSMGKGRTVFYDTSMDHAAQQYAHTVQRLRHALAAEAFELHYQPITSIADGHPLAAETLIRWRDEDLGRMEPQTFIRIAEEANLIQDIGRWTLDQACRQWARWQQQPEGPGIEYLTINVSGLELRDPGYVEQVRGVLERHQVPASCLQLEITESALIQELEEVGERLRALGKLGVKSIIDDFGTGYSSLSYLRRLPFSTLKIDQSFVSNVADDEASRALIRIMLEIAEQFDYKVVAEGVECQEQRLALAKLSPEILCQGYLCSRPLPADAFMRLIRKRRSVIGTQADPLN
jgi:diguanylate cyclase (GGDEF)-like protein/PAS domain S-box-containing protein